MSAETTPVGWAWLSSPEEPPRGDLRRRPQLTLVQTQQPPCTGEMHHLAFSDPPPGLTAERWEQYLRQGARDAPGVEDFTGMVLRLLGPELVAVHGVDPDVAEREVSAWARTIYEGERT